MGLEQGEKIELVGREKKLLSMKELGRELQFTYLPHLTFASEKLKKELYLSSGKKEAEVLGSLWKEQILMGSMPKVSIRWVGKEVGYGLYAEESLKAGSYLGEYVGEVRKNNHHTRISDYLYSYPVLDEIGRSYVIDAENGSLTRFINHSTRPNLTPTYAFFDGYYHLIFLVKTPIEKGEQLSYNYGRQYWTIRSRPDPLDF